MSFRSACIGCALIVFSTTGHAQITGSHSGTSWEVSPWNGLRWGGSAYLPIGIRIDGNPETIRRAADNGIQDVVVELPANGTGWKAAFDALESRQMRYVLAINSLAPGARGVAVDPAAYRVNGVTARKDLRVWIPGALSAFGVLALRQDGSVGKTYRFDVEDGWLRAEIAPGNELEHALLLYPRMRSQQQPDLWEGLDEHRDRLLIALRANPPGPGLRAILNPLGELLPPPSGSGRFVPESEYFRFELRGYLQNKYRNLDTVLRAWSTSASQIDSWEKLTRLVPLWSGSRGIPQMWDPVTGELVPCDSRRSTVWTDIGEVLAMAAAKRTQRLVAALRQEVDVPVLQDWHGWTPLVERQDPVFQGIGIRTRGTTPTEILSTASRAASTVYRWPIKGLLAATDVEVVAGENAQRDIANLYEDLVGLGAKALFFRADPSLWPAIAELAARRRNDSIAFSTSPRVFYFPENALNPAVPQRLPGGAWWLPAPYAGDRVDLGAPYQAFRMQGPEGANTFVLWRTDGAVVPAKLRVKEPKALSFVAPDGSEVKPSLARDGVTVPIGPSPLYIFGSPEIPVPQDAFDSLSLAFEREKKRAEDRKLNAMEDIFLFRDASNAFKDNPGGSFLAMRKSSRRLASLLGSSVWVEAESSRQNTFSETLAIPGTSAGSALNLRTELVEAEPVHYADLIVPVRTEQDQDVWLAARVPPSQRANVLVRIGDQEMRLQGEPVSLYANGFGWYRLGVTRLGGAQVRVRIEVKNPQGVDLAVDALYFTPDEFRPNGPVPPG
jgi:hypothetical protein